MAQNKTVRATDKVSFVNDEAELKERGYVVGIRLGEGSYAKVCKLITLFCVFGSVIRLLEQIVRVCLHESVNAWVPNYTTMIFHC